MLQRTLDFVYLHAHIQVNAENDQIAENVETAHAVEYVRIVEWYLFTRLHRHQDDYEVRSVRLSVVASCSRQVRRRTFVD